MKKQYFLTLLACWLTVLTASAQSPDVPSRRRSSEPLWGIGVQIPLIKLFGKKKAKALPQQPANLYGVAEPTTAPLMANSVLGMGAPAPAAPGGSADALPDDQVWNEECQCYIIQEINDDPPVVWGRGGGPGSGTTPPPPTVPGGDRPPGAPTPPSNGGSGGSPGSNPDPPADNNNFETPNTCEIAYLAEMAFSGRDPIFASAAMLRNASNVVTRIRTRFSNFSDMDSEPLNAVKHAMFQAFNACDFGEFDAANLARFHEECGEIPANRVASAQMDTFNNGVGFGIMRSVGCGDRDALEQAIFEAFFEGRLRKIDGNPTP